MNNSDKKIGGKAAWQHFRELISSKWHRAFVERIKSEIGEFNRINYKIAVTKLIGNKEDFENSPRLKKLFEQSSITISFEFITVSEMLKSILADQKSEVESTDFGRTVQVLRAAGIFNNKGS